MRMIAKPTPEEIAEVAKRPFMGESSARIMLTAEWRRKQLYEIKAELNKHPMLREPGHEQLITYALIDVVESLC